MLRLLILSSLVISQAFAAELIHVTSPGVYPFTVRDAATTITYSRPGHPQPGCVDTCDVFGCNRIPNPMCEPTTSVPTARFSHWVTRHIDLEVLPAPEGMIYDESFAADRSLSFKGSKQFAFLREDTVLSTQTTSSNDVVKKVHVTLRPMALKGLLASVTLDKHVSIVNGVLTYTLVGAEILPTFTTLYLERPYSAFEDQMKISLTSDQMKPFTVTDVTPAGIKHTVDLHKVLKKTLKKGTWRLSLRTSLKLNFEDILVESEFREKLQSSLWYSLKVR